MGAALVCSKRACQDLCLSLQQCAAAIAIVTHLPRVAEISMHCDALYRVPDDYQPDLEANAVVQVKRKVCSRVL